MIVILAAKYLQREPLEAFFGDLFPGGEAAVKVSASSCSHTAN